MEYIELTFLNVLSEIEKRPLGNPKITLKRIVPHPSNLRGHITEREITYSWPGKNREEAWRFGILDSGSWLLPAYEADVSDGQAQRALERSWQRYTMPCRRV